MLASCRRIYREIIPEPVRRALRDLVRGKGYSRGFFDWLDEQQAASYRIVASTIIQHFQPQRVVDVGCGSGGLLVELRNGGVGRVEGLESSAAGIRQCRKRDIVIEETDLEKPFKLASEFDLAVCLEVAEHLPAATANDFIRSITSGPRLVVFSAATPGQGGEGHVNEQAHDYWIEKFRQNGFRLDEALTAGVRASWRRQNVAPWYARNVMIFRRAAEWSE